MIQNLKITICSFTFLGLPISIMMVWDVNNWYFGILGCFNAYIITKGMAYVSVLTMIAFTFERFIAICYPLRPSLYSSVRRTRYFIGMIWFLSITFSMFWMKYVSFTKKDDKQYCGILAENVTFGMAALQIVMTSLLFLLPFISFFFIYVK